MSLQGTIFIVIVTLVNAGLKKMEKEGFNNSLSIVTLKKVS